MDDVLQISALIIAISGAAAAILQWVVKPLWKIAHGAYLFFEGTPPKGDKKGRPGIADWMDNVDRHLGNGSSPALHERVDDIAVKVERSTGEIAELWGMLNKRKIAR